MRIQRGMHPRFGDVGEAQLAAAIQQRQQHRREQGKPGGVASAAKMRQFHCEDVEEMRGIGERQRPVRIDIGYRRMVGK